MYSCSEGRRRPENSAPDTCLWARVSLEPSPPLLTGFAIPSAAHGPPPASHTEAQDMAGSDTTGSPFGVNVCTISGSGLLQAGRHNLLVASVELKIILLKIAKSH